MTLLDLEQMEKIQKNFDCSKTPTEKIFVERVGKSILVLSINYLIANKMILNLLNFSVSLRNFFCFPLRKNLIRMILVKRVKIRLCISLS